MKALVILAIALAPLTSMSQEGTAPQLTRPVDVVFCLDTSGSMEGLLNAVRARVWDVLNELGRMTPTPELHVGLLSYGTDRSTAQDGWIVKEIDLTSDLDAVYAQLMSLTVGGGDEYVGQVLHEAVWEMNWSRDPEALKIVFLAGNETADQNVEQYDFREIAEQGRKQGILVNALYAGNREQGVVELWPEVARAGNGTFSSIDPEVSTIQIATPQDEELLRLNAGLIETYLAYGSDGEKGLANQVAQDANASRLGVQSCSSRIVAKGSALYNNAQWDLVDATLQDGFDLAALSIDDLPEPMRAMTHDERVAFVDARRDQREQVQLEIQQVSAEREAYLQQVLVREGKAGGLDEAMREAIREQAKAKGLTSGC